MKGLETLHQAALTDVFRQISELGDMRTGPRNKRDNVSKTMDGLRVVPMFAVILSNTPTGQRSLNSSLRSHGIEVDQTISTVAPNTLVEVFISKTRMKSK